MTPDQNRPTTYWDYIHVDELLSLQGGQDGDESAISQDEVLFITVHQVYELWFKVAIQGVEEARDLFKQEAVPDDALAGACRLLERIRIIFDLSAKHFPLIETLTTRDYLDFRDKLFPANGGQSPQFRELELLLGLTDEQRVPFVTGGSYEEALQDETGGSSWALARVRARQQDKPSLREALDEWLHRTPINGSVPTDPDDREVVDSFVESYLESHARSLNELAEHVSVMAHSDSEREQLRERYQKEIESARRLLEADDAPEAERPRRRRIRVAALFIEIYRELPLLAWPREVLDRVVAVEQGFVYYRQRHARMAERIIGRRVGTGGSSGVDYLDDVALKYRIFRDLWAVRTILVRRDRLPDPKKPEFYGFRFA